MINIHNIDCGFPDSTFKKALAEITFDYPSFNLTHACRVFNKFVWILKNHKGKLFGAPECNLHHYFSQEVVFSDTRKN